MGCEGTAACRTICANAHVHGVDLLGFALPDFAMHIMTKAMALYVALMPLPASQVSYDDHHLIHELLQACQLHTCISIWGCCTLTSTPLALSQARTRPLCTQPPTTRVRSFHTKWHETHRLKVMLYAARHLRSHSTTQLRTTYTHKYVPVLQKSAQT